MDHYCLSRSKPISLRSLPSPVNYAVESSSQGFNYKPVVSTPIRCFSNRVGGFRRRGLIIAASYNNKELSSLNTPLEPITSAGKLLGRVLLDDPDDFQRATFQQLSLLAIDRYSAQYKIDSSKGDDEKCLNRRIFELRKPEWQIAVEDIMYMSLLYKFRKIGVHLTPKLSSCIYNHRLEISSKDWELESIHSVGVLEIIKEHLTTPLDLKPDSNVKESWATTRIPLHELSQIYETSILYGYFLKSASLRHQLELCFGHPRIAYRNPPKLPASWYDDITNAEGELINWICSLSFNQKCCTPGKRCDKLMCYIMELDPVTVRMCGKPRTKESFNLIQKHTAALFMGKHVCSIQEEDEVIVTSFSSLKTMVMEGIALGTFLWDTEDYVDDIYKLAEKR